MRGSGAGGLPILSELMLAERPLGEAFQSSMTHEERSLQFIKYPKGTLRKANES